MLMCTRCKKRPAVVFITAVSGEEKRNEGLCIVCAKELGIPQVSEYLADLGVTDSDIEELSDQFMEFSSDDFEMGGAGTSLPAFIQNMYPFNKQNKDNKPEPKDKGENKALEESGERDSEQEEFFHQAAQAAQAIANSDDNYPEPLPFDKEHERSGGGKPGFSGSKHGDKQGGDKAKKLKFLSSYCSHLTQRARDGQLDCVVGRDKEIARVVQILSRRTKNNPCLIGEPGVGKTAIAEGIAQRIASGNVPFQLAGKELYLLDLTALVAGTQFRGQFESRVKGLVDEVKGEGNIILFIDEVHNLVGTGDSEGSMNAANILKPSLSRGELQVIGATTFKEYRKYIEKDSALERRFQPVTVLEPTIPDTILVLEGIKDYYERHHRVQVPKGILKLCAMLSERYINDRFLPDKAIDLLDEACANRAIRSKELTEQAELNVQLKRYVDQETAIEESDKQPDYELLANVKGEILRLKERLLVVEEAIGHIAVEEEDLSRVIELWTGIPANKIMETEYHKLGQLEGRMGEQVIGQESAVKLVANAIKRTRVQLAKRRRPASFIFVGPTGVGKTELVKVLANELFDSVDPLIRLDMTEYMERHSVARIIGSPPGYVGYDDAGQLTEKVRRKPYSVVLFDEIEKAHPDVMNILLQILDEGHINDSQGRTVSFENTIIAMTSNAGSSDKSGSGMGFNRSFDQVSSDRAMKALSDFLRPEFLARVDEVVVFNPLTTENYKTIAGLMLNEMVEPLEEKNITFRYDDKALACIAKKSFGGKFGARDIRKVIRTQVEDKVAELLVTHEKPVSAIQLTASAEADSEEKGELEVVSL